MHRFIPTIRSDRFREAYNYENKGYSINKADYIYVDDILIKSIAGELLIEVRVDIHEVNFYIKKNGSRIYLEMIDIYEFLVKFTEILGSIVMEHLKKYINIGTYAIEDNEKADNKYYAEFSHKNVKYYFSQIPDFNKYNECTYLENIDIKLNYEEILTLLFLIQAKSNYFEKLSHSKYINGLINMMITLLTNKKDNKILENHGWVYDKEMGKFKIISDYYEKKLFKRKFYLTSEEMKDILSLES